MACLPRRPDKGFKLQRAASCWAQPWTGSPALCRQPRRGTIQSLCCTFSWRTVIARQRSKSSQTFSTKTSSTSMKPPQAGELVGHAAGADSR